MSDPRHDLAPNVVKAVKESGWFLVREGEAIQDGQRHKLVDPMADGHYRCYRLVADEPNT